MALYMDAEIAPARSLSPRAMRNVLIGAAIANLIIAGVMIALRAWPAPVFLGLDMLGLWLAFRAIRRSGLGRELVRVSAEAVTVVRRGPEGDFKAQWTSKTAFTRVLIEGEDDEVRITLAEQGRRRILAGALSPPERRDFGQALQTAISRARAERYR